MTVEPAAGAASAADAHHGAPALADARTPSDERFHRRVLEGVVGIPATEGNDVTLLRNGDQIFPAMLGAISAATRSVDLLTFVYWSGDIADRFAEALSERARAGVRVRVLLDAVGARSMRKDLVEEMREAGCSVRYFRVPELQHPIRSGHRTHRKVLVCDEIVGFTGGVGIAEEWTGDGRHKGQWRDTHVRIVGPAVDGLRAAFLDNWSENEYELFDNGVDLWPEHDRTGSSAVQVVTGTSEPGWNAVSTSLRALIELAQHRLRVTTAYFVPDDDLVDRLQRAVARGVAVDILVPGPHADKRLVQATGESCYRELLDAGVSLWCYEPSMLHAKLVTVDGAVAAIGSANFNNRSTSLDEEVNLIVFDRDVVAELDADFDADLEYAIELDPARWRDRNVAQRGLERVLKIAKPFM